MIQSGMFWLVLGLSCTIYWYIPARYRLAFLALCSFAYLSTLDPISTGFLLFGSCSIKFVFDHYSKRSIKPPKAILFVIALIILLCAAKVLPGILENLFGESSSAAWAIPLGVSYYTFKLIHYSVERSRSNLAEINYDEYLCWLFLFPTFTAGPIEQLEHFRRERKDNFDANLFTEGLWRIIVGLIKKLVVADLLIRDGALGGHTVISALQSVDVWPVWQVWAFFMLLYLIFYLDFSAYSDIAIGASRLFGIRIMENFNWPVLATNISDFWKRWHITLAAFCQRYVYMPVIARTRNPYLAIYCTFITMGIWHAANINYLLWGVYHATGVATVLTFSRVKRTFGWNSQLRGPFKYWGVPITFLYVSISGIFSGTNGLGAEPILIFAKALLSL